MITRVEVLNYRCLRYINRPLAPFQILIGPNASGKSAFLDVISLTADLVREREGPITAVRSRAPDVRDLVWMHQTDAFELAVEARIPERIQEQYTERRYTSLRYEIRLGLHPDTQELGLLNETLWLQSTSAKAVVSSDGRQSRFPALSTLPETILHRRTPVGWRKVVNRVLESGNDYFFAETSRWNNPFRLGLSRSVLANLPEDEQRFPASVWFRRFLLEGVQELRLNSQAMRAPSPPGSPRAFQPDGSNLPWVIHELEKNHRPRLQEWIAHLRTALPDLRDVYTVERPEDRHRYLVLRYTTGLEAPSWVVSDGTLRLMALTLLAYLPNLEGVYLIEEPENGIHPRAVETVLQSLSSIYSAQVLLATHSPVILSLAQPEDVLCFARTEDGATDIVLGTEHPRLREWRYETDLGTLFASGVLG